MILDARIARQLERLYSNRGRWGEGPPHAPQFITPDRVRIACSLPTRGWPIPCTLPGANAVPPDLVPRISANRPSPDGIAGRGVLLDLARSEGLPWLPDGLAVPPEQLDTCAERQGIAVESGDVLLIRTGWLSHCLSRSPWETYANSPAPGLSLACARWLYEREIALVASDTAWVEVRPSEIPEIDRPLRRVSLTCTGIPFGENFHVDALAEACAADGNYGFLFVCPPLYDADACPAQPLAIK